MIGALVAFVATLAIEWVVSDTSSSARSACGWGSFSHENPPGACWRPFSADSPFNRPLSVSPSQAPDSEAIGRTVAGWGNGLRLTVGNAGTSGDFNHPIYFSARSNPVFRVNCLDFGGDCEIDGDRLRIPNLARAAGGSDGHLAVIDQRHGWEYDFWRVADKPAGGGRLDVGWGGRTKIGTTRSHGLRSAGTAAGFALSAGLIRPAELASGEIDHALFMNVACTNGTTVFPAHRNSGNACSGGASGARAPAMGQHLFLEMTDGEIDALSLPGWQKTILRAMARYGMFVGDTGGPGWGLIIESGSSFTSFGIRDPWLALARRLGLPEVAGDDGLPRYVLDMRGAVDWASELRVGGAVRESRSLLSRSSVARTPSSARESRA